MRLGVRGHDVDRNSIEVLSKKIKEKGFKSIHLALSKAITNIDTSYGKINPGLAYHIRSQLENNDIQISLLGCYINMVHPNIDERKILLERFKEHIRYARDFGCSLVGTETGSCNADYSYSKNNHSEEAFVIFINSVKELIKEAEKFGVLVGIEGVTTHIINTPQRMKRVLDIIDSNHLQVIFDPVNLLSVNNYLEQDKMIEQSFELFGDKIALVHAKDFKIEDGKKVRVPAGKGLLNYSLLFKKVKEYKPYINITMEDLDYEDMEESKMILIDIYNKA